MDLTSSQLAAIDCIDGHLQIIACAGSGKTEVISRRIANILQKKPNVRPENVVAFTFTEKAAESLKKRIEAVADCNVSKMYIGTIHGFCKRLLNDYTEDFANFKVLDTVKNHLFLSRYSEKCGMPALGLKPCMLNNDLYLQCIDKLIDDYDHQARWDTKHREGLEQYIQCLYEHKYIDFSLLIFEALRKIQENPDVQAYLKEIKYLVVDEYQDVNDLQEKLIGAIANYGANVCVVGDDDQTIYQFRGSNADNMISFPDRYSNVKQIRLEENFRCQKGIVDVAFNVIGHNTKRLQKKMISGATPRASILQANGYADESAEFSAIADQIKFLHDKGEAYKEIAVLARKGKHIPKIAEALSQKGIPYTADSAEDFFAGKYFSRFVETLRILDNIDKKNLYDQWNGLIDDAYFNRGFKFLRSCTRGGVYRLSEILRSFCENIDFLNEEHEDYSARVEDLEGFCFILDDYDEIYGDYQLSARISGLLRFLTEQARQEYKYHNFRECPAGEDAVQLMTVHKSKGLQFETVFLPRLNKREFPVSKMGGKKYYHVLGGAFEENKAKYESDIEDERKLFYVAITRAKANLFLSFTLEDQPLSLFMEEIAESSFVKMNRDDLQYQPPKKMRSYHPRKNLSIPKDDWEPSENDFAAKEEYWSTVRRAREALFEEYATANHFCKGIIEEYSAICRQGPDAILEKASSMGLI